MGAERSGAQERPGFPAVPGGRLRGLPVSLALVSSPGNRQLLSPAPARWDAALCSTGWALHLPRAPLPPSRPVQRLARGGPLATAAHGSTRAPGLWPRGLGEPGSRCFWGRGTLPPHPSQAVPSPPHLLGLRGQGLLQEGLPQEVQVVQTAARRQRHRCRGLAVRAGNPRRGGGFCAIRRLLGTQSTQLGRAVPKRGRGRLVLP